MNAWTTLISRLDVDRKPIPRIKVPKVKRMVVFDTPVMTRQEVCKKANKALQLTRKKMRDRNKERVYTETMQPCSAQDISDNLNLAKPYVRTLLLELIDEGRVKRYKVVLREAFSSKEVIGYHYERV